MMTNNYDRFISINRKSQPTANCWSCSNVVLFKSSPSVPLVLLWLSYGTWKWIRSAFDECLVIRRYTMLTNIGSSAHEVGLAHHKIRFGRQITNERKKIIG